MSRALIAMSGGVDSSVAAYLMKQAGYDCYGMTMRLSSPEQVSDGCCTPEDVALASQVAAALHIPFQTVDYAASFRHTVIEDFIRTYCEGGTPNPCVVCNRRLKFGMLMQEADKLGADCIVTGHYVRTSYDAASDRHLLLRGKDEGKDQSYVLYTLSQEQLARAHFPLGFMTKEQVRSIAEAQGMINASRKDSQDICFVPDGDYAAFIERTLQASFPAGDFVDSEGRVLGQHKGIIRYTIGQRKGLGLALPAPLYVAQKDIQNNRVLLVPDRDLYTDTLTAEDVNLISLPEISGEIRVTARVRYHQKDQPATLTQLDEDHIKLVFDAPQRAIAKGQSVVFYDGDVVVGGGRIC